MRNYIEVGIPTVKLPPTLDRPVEPPAPYRPWDVGKATGLSVPFLPTDATPKR